ncbi:hypothetical protein CMQ_8178 [Grosmannia clavigera kw1407]|uniref:SsuA/THI5-like domain-containing protein n=1 Tax=Grosmannia clavigera (strain kw1407 / UAMH 11150) TaxID=655863 RepID=F0XKQ6_GROCL|nr:uncharacterized protein CMQ_8178 [Grosmannia clavigera kw1407]EFX01712.1 hypothetical protein CMQ_8178 [Grosmannia clavigera kw1407]
MRAQVTMPVRVLAMTCLVAGCLALDTVQYGAFLPTATYSVANQLGFFEAFGLDVVYNLVPNSVSAFNSLLDGDYDILTATVDNALNYRFNKAENVTVLGQLDQGPDLVVASIPSITAFSQLKGKPIMVDSPTSGYAYLLQDVLSANGLELANGDYYFMTVGGTATRYAALTSGALANGSAAYATILNYPFTVEGAALAAAEAPTVLARVSDLVAPITSSAFTVSETALASSATASLLTSFLAAMHGANRFLLDSANQDCSIAAIAAQVGITSAVAASEYSSAVNTVSGEIASGGNFTVSHDGITNDIDVRTKFGGFAGLAADFDWSAALQPGSGQLIDYAVRDAAIRLFNEQPYAGNCSQSAKVEAEDARKGDGGAEDFHRPAATLADYQREVLRRGFRDALALGQVRPLLLPWCIVPSFVLPALYLALPQQYGLQAARIPLAVAIVALNVSMLPSPWWPPVSSLNFASAYGAGLLAAWGSLWTLTVLVWTNPQRDAERVERRPALKLERNDINDINDVMALDASIAQSLQDGSAYFWQSFPADHSFLTRLDWTLDLVMAWRGTGWNWCISQLPRFRPPRHAHSAESVELDSMAIRSAAGFRRHRSYAAFVSSRLLAVVAGYLVLDIAAVVMTLDPFFVFGSLPEHLAPDLLHLLQLPPVLAFVYRYPALLSLYRAFLCLAGVVAGLYMYLSISHLALVLLLGRRGPLHWLTGSSTTRAELWHYPSIFGSFNQLLDHGLAGFWGGFWHQTFRVAFVAPTAWLVRLALLSPPRARNADIKTGSTHPVGLVIAFLQSGFLHAAGSSTSAGRARSLWWQQPLFFALAGAGIAV